jgi:hypothetical protein
MKMSHELASRTPGPLWGLALGLLHSTAGLGFGYYVIAIGRRGPGR